MTNWPDINQEFEQQGFSEAASNDSIMTNMDAGPPKRRRRFTAGIKKLSGVIQMSSSELLVLEDFYYNTVREVEEFIVNHPRLGSPITVVFSEPPSWTYFAPNIWKVTVKFDWQP